jgi:hypothetical protein
MHRHNETSFLDSINLVGMEPIEPVILPALITAEPLLLIGPHGCDRAASGSAQGVANHGAQ